MKRMTKRLKVSALLPLALLTLLLPGVLVGCGGSDSGDSTGTNATVPTGLVDAQTAFWKAFVLQDTPTLHSLFIDAEWDTVWKDAFAEVYARRRPLSLSFPRIELTKQFQKVGNNDFSFNGPSELTFQALADIHVKDASLGEYDLVDGKAYTQTWRWHFLWSKQNGQWKISYSQPVDFVDRPILQRTVVVN